MALWAISFAMGMSVVYGEDSVNYSLERDEPAQWLNVSYNTFARSAWGFAMSWLIFACFHGYGGDNSTLQQKTLISIYEISETFRFYQHLLIVGGLWTSGQNCFQCLPYTLSTPTFDYCSVHLPCCGYKHANSK